MSDRPGAGWLSVCTAAMNSSGEAIRVLWLQDVRQSRLPSSPFYLFFFLIFLWTFNRLAVHHHRAEGPGSPGGRRTGVTKEPGWSRGGEDECTVLSC